MSPSIVAENKATIKTQPKAAACPAAEHLRLARQTHYPGSPRRPSRLNLFLFQSKFKNQQSSIVNLFIFPLRILPLGQPRPPQAQRHPLHHRVPPQRRRTQHRSPVIADEPSSNHKPTPAHQAMKHEI